MLQLGMDTALESPETGSPRAALRQEAGGRGRLPGGGRTYSCRGKADSMGGGEGHLGGGVFAKCVCVCRVVGARVYMCVHVCVHGGCMQMCVQAVSLFTDACICVHTRVSVLTYLSPWTRRSLFSHACLGTVARGGPPAMPTCRRWGAPRAVRALPPLAAGWGGVRALLCPRARTASHTLLPPHRLPAHLVSAPWPPPPQYPLPVSSPCPCGPCAPPPPGPGAAPLRGGRRRRRRQRPHRNRDGPSPAERLRACPSDSERLRAVPNLPERFRAAPNRPAWRPPGPSRAVPSVSERARAVPSGPEQGRSGPRARPAAAPSTIQPVIFRAQPALLG